VNELDEGRRKHLVGRLRHYVNERANWLGDLVGISVGVHIRVGDVATEILQLAGEAGASMIVVGAKAKGVRDDQTSRVARGRRTNRVADS